MYLQVGIILLKGNEKLYFNVDRMWPLHLWVMQQSWRVSMFSPCRSGPVPESLPICVFIESKKNSQYGLIWAFYVLQNNMKYFIAQSPIFFDSGPTNAFKRAWKKKYSIGWLKSSIFLENSLLLQWVMQQLRHFCMKSPCRSLFIWLS